MTVLQPHELTSTGLPLVEVLVDQSDLAQPGRLSSQLEDIVRVRPERVVVDLHQCSTIDATALWLLLEAHCEVRRYGGILVLRGLRPRLHRMIELRGLAGVFDVEGPAPC